MKNTMRILAMLVLGGLVMLGACKKHSDPTPLSLSTMTAGDADLNGATAPSGVDPAAAIVATFSTNVDPSSATTSTITLTRDFDQTDVAIAISVSGKTITVTPSATLSGGATFVLALKEGIKSTDGLALAPLTRSFTTSGSFTPDGQISYWSFENNGNDVVGSNDPASAGDVVAITYIDGRNAAAGKAASFNGTTSIIEIPNGDQIINPEFSLAFWMDLDSSALKADGVSQRGHFVMGMGAFNAIQFEVEDRERWMKWAQMYKRVNGVAIDTNGRDVFWNGTQVVNGNGGDSAVVVSKTKTSAQIQALIGHQWNHVVYSFSAETKTTSLYWNGELIYKLDYNFFQNHSDANLKKFYGVVAMAFRDPGANPGLDYYDKTWAFGFWESRASTFPSWGQSGYVYSDPDAAHFKGALDDVHLFHRAITPAEVTLMYNSEK